MGKIIAVNGKGGTGKTTIAALLVAHLIEARKGSILAVDADPNSCFAGALGVKNPQTIVGACEEVSKNMDKIPSGMAKDRFIEQRVQESLAEESGFDLLVMGNPEGPGCYCYVNNLLRGLIGRITKGYDYVVIDNAAGMEHISRRTTGAVGALILVSDYSANGIRAAKTIYDLARDIKIKVAGAYLIVNRVDGPLAPLKNEMENTGLTAAGDMPYSEELAEWSLSDRSLLEFNDAGIKRRIGEIFTKFTENENANRTCERKV